MPSSLYRDREAPANALFQGDVLVVPEAGIGNADPELLTYDPRERTKCGTCGKLLETDNCPDEECKAQLRWPRSKVVRAGLKTRQAASQDGQLLPPGKLEVVTTFNVRLGLVTSNCCDIDQQGVACFLGVRGLDDLTPPMRERLEKRGRLNSLLYLPGTSTMSACAVDLNAEFSLPAKCLGVTRQYWSPKKQGTEKALIPFKEIVEGRLASMSLDGLKALYAARFRHMTRTEAEFDFATLEFEEIEPERPADIAARGWRLPTPSWAKPKDAPQRSQDPHPQR